MIKRESARLLFKLFYFPYLYILFDSFAYCFFIRKISKKLYEY